MLNTTFREWLIDEQWKKLFETVLFLETDSLDAAMASNNMQFTQAFGGVRKNWFGIILSQAQKYAKGADILTAASEAASELLMALHKKDPADPFWQGVERILSIPDESQKENELAAFFLTAATLRARRFARQYHRKSDQRTSQFSALDARGSSGGNSSIANIADPHSEDDDMASPEDRMDRLRRGVMMELERMKAAANDKRTVARFELAKQVAEKRMENPPNFPSLEELMAMFPDIKKTMMFQILQDIQTAAEKAAGSIGIDASRMRKRKTG